MIVTPDLLDDPRFIRSLVGVLVARLGNDVTLRQAEFDAVKTSRLIEDYDTDKAGAFYRLQVRTQGH